MRALRNFKDAWVAIDGSAQRTLQSAYITDNPFPTGSKVCAHTCLYTHPYACLCTRLYKSVLKHACAHTPQMHTHVDQAIHRQAQDRTRTRTHAPTHARAQTHTRACTHADTHARMHTCRHTCARTHAHMHMHAPIHTPIHARTHSLMHPHMHACMHACKHAGSTLS